MQKLQSKYYQLSEKKSNKIDSIFNCDYPHVTMKQNDRILYANNNIFITINKFIVKNIYYILLKICVFKDIQNRLISYRYIIFGITQLV